MAKSTPQDKPFYYTQLFNKLNNWLLVATIILPILASSINIIEFKNILNSINFFFMAIFAGFTYIVTFYLLPKSENIRRNDYFSNTFNLHTTQDSSEKYFTNDEIKKGLYKMAINLFENCFFTYNVSSKMLIKSIGKTIIFVIPLLLFAYTGFQNNLFAQAIFQIFLSAIIFGESIKLALYNANVKKIMEQIESLLCNTDFKKNINKYAPTVIKLYITYETNISWAGILLDSKIFQGLNSELTTKWERIKEKYKIKPTRSSKND